MLSSIGFYNMHMHNDIWELLSPSGMPGEYERQAIQQVPMISGRGYYQVGRPPVFLNRQKIFFADKNPLHRSQE